MDTYKEKQRLDDMYAAGEAHWEVWKDSPPVVPTLSPTAGRRFKLAKPG